MRSPNIQDFAREGRPTRQERADYLKAKERAMVALPDDPKPPTLFERLGARAIAGEMRAVDTADGKRKLGSAYGGSGAAFNRIVTKPGKVKVKRRPKTESDLRLAMQADAKAIRKLGQLDTLMPDTSPALLSARRKAERMYRNAKPRKKRSPPRHRRAK